MLAKTIVGCVITTELLPTHPKISVTVTLYVPAVKLDTAAVVAPPEVHK